MNLAPCASFCGRIRIFASSSSHSSARWTAISQFIRPAAAFGERVSRKSTFCCSSDYTYRDFQSHSLKNIPHSHVVSFICTVYLTVVGSGPTQQDTGATLDDQQTHPQPDHPIAADSNIFTKVWKHLFHTSDINLLMLSFPDCSRLSLNIIISPWN